MTNATVTVRDFRFFREHGGWIVGQRALSAIGLARAEAEARNRGLTFEWSEDSDPELGDHEYWCRDAERGIEHAHEALSCVAFDGDQVVASLGSIIDPDRAYIRVVEAELAAEAV